VQTQRTTGANLVASWPHFAAVETETETEAEAEAEERQKGNKTGGLPVAAKEKHRSGGKRATESE